MARTATRAPVIAVMLRDELAGEAMALGLQARLASICGPCHVETVRDRSLAQSGSDRADGILIDIPDPAVIRLVRRFAPKALIVVLTTESENARRDRKDGPPPAENNNSPLPGQTVWFPQDRGVRALADVFITHIPEVTARSSVPPHAAAKPTTTVSLTTLERDILRLFADGRSAKEVGRALGLSTKAAENRKFQVMKKLGARSVVMLTRIAIRDGLIDP